MNKIVLGVVGVFFLLVIAVSCGSYNNLVDREENVLSAWSQVQNQYQRRADLAQQLVQAVDVGLAQEREIFDLLTEQAQALAGAFTGTNPENVSSEELQSVIDGFDAALINAISYVADNPELISGELLQNLMVQIEGSENRVSVARRDYILAVETYRLATRRFPGSIFAGIFGFDASEYAYFQANSDAQNAPDLDFSPPGGN